VCTTYGGNDPMPMPDPGPIGTVNPGGDTGGGDSGSSQSRPPAQLPLSATAWRRWSIRSCRQPGLSGPHLRRGSGRRLQRRRRVEQRAVHLPAHPEPRPPHLERVGSVQRRAQRNGHGLPGLQQPTPSTIFAYIPPNNGLDRLPTDEMVRVNALMPVAIRIDTTRACARRPLRRRSNTSCSDGSASWPARGAALLLASQAASGWPR
jgi:hypothetical protein